MIRILHRFEEALLCLLLTSLTLLVFAETLLRFSGTSALWLEEAIQWNVGWFVLFGASYGVRTGAHIGLTLLTGSLKNPLVKRGVALVALMVCFAYCAIFLYSSWEYVRTQMMIGFEMNDLQISAGAFGSWPQEDIAVKQWVPYCGLLIGFSLLLVRFAVLLVKVLRGKDDGFHFIDEAQESVEMHAQEVRMDDNHDRREGAQA
ncbi:MAG: TRAP transporter small permease subunit [Cardiobacteriaceae bacterium]|nr:TRAP transporter small permease subunit [Cardiobacteriaceae bacterium]